LFKAFFHPETDSKTLKSIDDNFRKVSDLNERIAYLRALVIGKLTRECAEIFTSYIENTNNALIDKSLFSFLTEPSKSAMARIREISVNKIYNDRAVIEIEIAGYKILGTLLEAFITAVLEPDQFLSRKLLALIPQQYLCTDVSNYSKIQSVVDFVSGMTDLFALELYRKITGMELPGIG
jgi:dGTPase